MPANNAVVGKAIKKKSSAFGLSEQALKNSPNVIIYFFVVFQNVNIWITNKVR
jgi:hypothetical protein